MMKQHIKEFFRRGLMSCSLGPLVLVVLYLILQQQIGLQTLTVQEVCLGVLTLSALAFLAGGMNVIYSIEQLPLISAILIHGSVLYVGYLATYLVNGWLDSDPIPFFIFTVCFFVAYAVVWTIIYLAIRNNANRLNKKLSQLQKNNQEKNS